MSAPAIRAWNSVTRQQLEEVLARLHPDDRSSYEATVAVGLAVAVLTVGAKGYCDSTRQQFYTHLKGSYGESVIRNALWAIRVGGIVAQVRGGTIAKNGKGRGAHLVFVEADTHELIPDGYVPPLPRRNPPTGQDLSQSHDESDTGKHDSDTGQEESDTGHDLEPLKESINSSTAALAGRSTIEDSLRQVDAEESEMPPTVEKTPVDEGKVQRLVSAVMGDDSIMQGTSPLKRKGMRPDIADFARRLLWEFPEPDVPTLVKALKVFMHERKDMKTVGPERYERLLEIAEHEISSVF
jgi:hypothetical protein